MLPKSNNHNLHTDILSQDDLIAELKRKDAQIASLIEQKKLIIEEKNRINEILNGVINSRSWKLTSVLRGIKYKARRLFPLIRLKKFTFIPKAHEHITLKDSQFVTTGSTPQLLLDCGQSCPFGWVTIKADFACEKEQMFFLLYYGMGQGFTGDKRLWLALENRKRNKTMEIGPLRIPYDATQLRLDPFELDLPFQLTRIEIKPLGSLQLFFKVINKQLSPVITKPGVLGSKINKAYEIFKTGGIQALKLKLFTDNQTHNYQDWVKRYDTLTDKDHTQIKDHIETFSLNPKISIILPIYKTPVKLLKQAIDSVKKQLYENWELCIADDFSESNELKKLLEKYQAEDERIKVVFRESNGHISAASNSALDLATGSLVGLLDHDDELREHALYLIVAELNNNPHVQFFYTDEDKINSFGFRFNPYFKSDWNPELLLTQNYICHFTVCSTELVRKVGGFRKGFEGAQDWDLILRVTDCLEPSQIKHIPHIAYHWKVVEGSTAGGTDNKPYVLKAQKKAVEEHLSRTSRNGEVEIRKDISHLKIRFKVPSPEPRITLVMPTKDQPRLLSQCVMSILDKTIYQNYHILIVDNGSKEEDTFELFDELKKTGKVSVLRDDGEFNFARINNEAVKTTDSEYVGFLNNDLEVISPHWLEEMMSYACQQPIGAVGARLLYPNGLLQHGGVLLGIGGVAGHSHKGRLREDPGYFNRAILPHDVSGVTAACLVMKRSIFDEIKGFDQENLAVAFNDVDFCLRIRELGYRIVYTAYAELFHHESASRGYETTPEKYARFEKETEYMKKRWGAKLKEDPYYNPNLTLLTEDFALSFPSRAIKPWKKKK